MKLSVEINDDDYGDDGQLASITIGRPAPPRADGTPDYFSYPQSLFAATARYASCCGITELCEFDFNTVKTDEEATELAKLFHESVVTLGRKANKGIVHLTLTQSKEDTTHSPEFFYQPKWFVDAVRSFPNVVGMPAPLMNPNSGNMIWMFMLPTGADINQ
jgi:hypothetical protein